MSGGCAAGPEPELVLQEGARLTAKTSSGNVSIVAGRGFDRKYEWDGCSLSANMGARKSRWFGSMGIYDPAGSFGRLGSGCNGISRTVVQERQIHFEDRSAAEEWMARYRKTAPTVWSDDGLLVQWDLVPGREQINVDLWQICIAGRRPSELSGATNQALELAPISGRHDCATVSSDVLGETKKAWQDWWTEVDDWNAKLSHH